LSAIGIGRQPRHAGRHERHAAHQSGARQVVVRGDRCGWFCCCQWCGGGGDSGGGCRCGLGGGDEINIEQIVVAQNVVNVVEFRQHFILFIQVIQQRIDFAKRIATHQ
jgi:hypothetical protein